MLEQRAQVLYVKGNRNGADVSLYNKKVDGSRQELLSTFAYVGENGFGKIREGDGKTPVGTFCFSCAFGILPDPGTVFNYIQVDDDYYWVDDSQSVYYNQLVDIKQTEGKKAIWSSAESIKQMGKAYNYVLALNYNWQCIPERGSGIFLHCIEDGKKSTKGCVAVPEADMIKIMKLVCRHCEIIIET